MRDCPCGSGRAFDDCCGALLAGAPAASAEALMRSRYSAHVVGDVDYIVRTHDPRSRDQLDRVAIGRWARESEWLGLTIVATEAGGAGDDSGVVEFQARYAIRAGVQLHHERSRFRRVDGAWVYVDGDFVKPTPARKSDEVGRNDPCPCGSGKKYKKCHGG